MTTREVVVQVTFKIVDGTATAEKFEVIERRVMDLEKEKEDGILMKGLKGWIESGSRYK